MRKSDSTEMQVSHADNALLVRFPGTSESDSDKPGMRRAQFDEVEPAHQLYFALSSGQPITSSPQKQLDLGAYQSYHPERVAFLAFRQHFNYTLAPEAVGAQILLEVGEFINRNAEKCAPIFNGQVGQKKDIKVWLNPGDSLKDQEVFYGAIGQWEAGVRKETDSRIANALHPEFSRKNQVIDAVYAGLLMGAAKEFFEYSFSTLCGIPNISVEGSKQDWDSIYHMAAAIASVPELGEIKPYCEYAGSVLENIIKLYQGKEDPAFWRSIFKYEDISGSEGTSAGWLPSLCLYADKEGTMIPNESRWSMTGSQDEWDSQVSHLKVPVVNVTLVSDNSVGMGNIDPSLSVNFGFTGLGCREKYLTPVLGIDAYAMPEANK